MDRGEPEQQYASLEGRGITRIQQPLHRGWLVHPLEIGRPWLHLPTEGIAKIAYRGSQALPFGRKPAYVYLLLGERPGGINPEQRVDAQLPLVALPPFEKLFGFT